MPGYVVSREVARGGMGVVFAAHDPAFEREVAVKVMHPGQDAGRFVVESKVTARLTHPGIPPVYDLGVLDDGRPFLAMKLVEGRTLAGELSASNRETDLPRLLGVFEQICQTVGFAHARGIVHRDLKPANVMVGRFGEALVMDWGLARTGGGAPDPGTEGGGGPPGGGYETVPGQVKGTPAYMAPEQARGEPVDARADVFALGGILAVVLTGRPPFTGDTGPGTVLKAARAELGACFAQLDACGADAELIAVAKKCLAPEPAARFADGAEVAAAVAAYRAGVEDRLRRAERDRAVSAAEAREQRKRRRVQLALGGLVAVVLAAGVGLAWYSDRRAGERERKEELAEAERKASESRLAGERDAERRLKTEVARRGVAVNLRLATDLRRQHRFRLADEALVQAAAQARDGAPELLGAVEQARGDLAFAVELDAVRMRKHLLTTHEGGARAFKTVIASLVAPRRTPGGRYMTGESHTHLAPREYRRAFAERGLDLTTVTPDDAAKRIASSAIKAELVAAVDDWALYEPDPELRDRLATVARGADPGPWTDRLRTPASWADKTALARLAADADPVAAAPAALSVLAELLARTGSDPSPLLAAARAAHPTEFELAFVLGQWHCRNDDGRQIGPYEAARALRPDNATVWNNLGVALKDAGDANESLAAFREAIKLDPQLADAHCNLGTALWNKDDLDGAIAEYNKAIELDPHSAPAHGNLAGVLREKGDLDGAVAAYKEVVRLDPLSHLARHDLGLALHEKGDLDGAIAAYKDAIRLDPRLAPAHSNLGSALYEKGDLAAAIAAHKQAIELEPRNAKIHYNLGNALWAKRDAAGAVAAYKEAIRLDPKNAPAHSNLGNVLADTGDLDGAVASHREAIRLDPRLAPAHNGLGGALWAKGDADGAIAAYKEAIKLEPKNPRWRTNLGGTYLMLKRYEESIACTREAIKTDPKWAEAHALLGLALWKTGDLSGARAALAEALRLDRQYAPVLAKLPPMPVAPPPREVNR